VFFFTLYQIVGYLAWIVTVFVIVQFILSLLLAFNVVSMRNHFVGSVWRALNALLDPILRPIRRILPDTGAIDFSPLVLIVLLRVIMMILAPLAVASLS
jgi:YggT family protein